MLFPQTRRAVTFGETLLWFLAVDAAASFVAYHVWPWFRDASDEALSLLHYVITRWWNGLM